MSQQQLRNDLKWCPGSTGICGGVSKQIMGFQVNSDQVTGLFNNDPGGRVGYRENPVTGFDPIVTDIFLEPVRYFLGQGEPREPGRPENRRTGTSVLFIYLQ